MSSQETIIKAYEVESLLIANGVDAALAYELSYQIYWEFIYDS